ncbi:MAG: hypothetical protein AB2745_02205 [Candidatus Thiodiazotropha endolucinida]|nr:hypothetical protein [Candidatus Thiodiazotropha sp. (ex Lucina pensylvanica)]MBT3051181.1 hypothetical protein [Candidatus Thiodiazotropha sp. (ex Codakia orbicularis)]
MKKKLLKTLFIAFAIFFIGVVSIGAGKIFPAEIYIGPRGGMIEFVILIFCVALVGLYWLIAIHIPKIRQNRSKGDK